MAVNETFSLSTQLQEDTAIPGKGDAWKVRLKEIGVP
jgi:hypothetical protein